MAETEDDNKSTLFCSFCGMRMHDVKKIIDVQTVFILD